MEGNPHPDSSTKRKRKLNPNNFYLVALSERTSKLLFFGYREDVPLHLDLQAHLTSRCLGVTGTRL